MPFATDRDILALEPTAFRDLIWVSQTLLTGQLDVAGTAAEMTPDSSDLIASDVQAGAVIVAQGVALEIVSVDGATECTVSLLRASRSGPALPAPKFNGVAAYIATFLPQLELAHRMALRCAGIDPDALPGHTPTITNPGAFVTLEALGALHLIWAAAGAASGDQSPANRRAETYRRRWNDERQRVVAEIDLDGDGHADVSRRLNAVVLCRT